MSISQEKKDFIKKVAPGIHVCMTITYQADEIAVNAVEPAEEYIQTHMLVYEKSVMGDNRWWFSEKLFCKFVDTMDDETIREVLLYLDDVNMCLSEVFDEACIDTRDLTDYERTIDFTTFGELLDHT